MEVDQLTDEQVANLTPEQIEMLENDPGKLSEILGIQEAPKEAPRGGARETKRRRISLNEKRNKVRLMTPLLVRMRKSRSF